MTVILIAGPAGVGKSTLGRALAADLRMPLLDLDTVTNPLLEHLFADRAEHWNDASLRPVMRPARYAALFAVVAEQVAVGTGVVAVAPFTAELAGGAEWEDMCAVLGEVPHVVWLTASAAVLAERRAARAADRDAHIVHTDDEPRVPHLRIDAADTTEKQVRMVRDMMDADGTTAGDGWDARHPIFSRTFAGGLFDLDGTLIDSTPAVNRSWEVLAQEYGLTIDLQAMGHGRPAVQTIERVFAPDQVAGALARIEELESTDLQGVIALPGGAELLAGFGDRGAIVTSGTNLIAYSRINAAGIVTPAAVVTFDDVVNGKPHPEPFLLGASRLGVDPAECVAFEDAPAGIAAANAAGCATVGIVGSHTADELAAADLVVSAIAQVTVERVEGGFRLRPA